MLHNLRTFLLLIVTLACSIQASAQGVSFLPEGTPFAEAVSKAKAEGKLLFVDCYTQWCGPCKLMSKDIFPQDTVGTVMNAAYVAIKMDMEAGEGLTVGKSWQVPAYPTFIIFNGDGKELSRFSGADRNAEGFLRRLKENSVDNGLSAMETRWQQGERDEAFLKEYLAVLEKVRKYAQCNEVAEVLLDGKAETFVEDEALRNIFIKNITDMRNPAFAYTVKHPERLTELTNERLVTLKIQNVFQRAGFKTLEKVEGGYILNQQAFDEWVAVMRSYGYAEENIEKLCNDVISRTQQK